MELRHKYDLNLLLNCTNVARSSFYYYQKQSKIPDKHKETKEWIKSIYYKHKGRYGYRRITDELNHKGSDSARSSLKEGEMNEAGMMAETKDGYRGWRQASTPAGGQRESQRLP